MPELSNPDPSLLDIPDKSGAPENRIKNAYQAWEVCDEMERADCKRGLKRTRIFNAYNRMPPSEYSKLFEQGAGWQSNTNFGMMAYVVDNNLSSFFDMVTERVSAADIRTKHGSPRERTEWSDEISNAFDYVLREWDDFLMNCEQDILDMLLFSKGIQMWESKEGCTTEHVSIDDFLVPDGTKVSFKNFDVCAVKRRYGLHELWQQVKDMDGKSNGGWNKENVLSAMRLQRETWRGKYKNNEEWSKAVADGDVTIAGHLKEYVHTYMLFIKEFKTGKISKYVVLKDYGPALSLTRKENRASGIQTEEDLKKKVINKYGFLFQETGYAEKIDDIFSVFMDCAGSGMWHRVPSLAEKIFVQCRQYDFTMNAIMDAIKVNMSLMLQASTPDATEKIKQLVFGPYTIIPSDVPFVQQRMQLDTNNATQALQFMMLDMFRGIGEYRINERMGGGQAVTATQNQNDTAEAAKLSGTQLKRFSHQHSLYYRKFYKRLIGLVRGEKDYEMLEKFKERLKDRGVPDKAWKWDNIECINSNMLAGAGSPSYKLMAAEKTINLTNVSPKDAGQANAVEDALAALHGRSNVSRYVNKVKPDKTINEKIAGWENTLLAQPFLNPADVQVNPEDNDVYHLDVHLFDMERTVSLVNERIEKGTLTPFLSESAAYKMMNITAHCGAHIEKMTRDEGNKEMVKVATQKLAGIQKQVAKIQKKSQAQMEEKQKGFDVESDPDVKKQIALGQLQVQTAQQLSQLKIGAIATSHEQKLQINKDKAANEIAINRAKEIDKINTKAKVSKTKPKK